MYQTNRRTKMSDSYQFQSEPFKYSEVILKGEKKFYVEGFISTIDPDIVDEVITINAQEDMLDQVVGRTITMDVEHSDWFSESGGVTNPNNTADKVLDKPKTDSIPVAKIVSAELKSRGVWAKVEINKSSPSFKAIWGSIKDGFLHSFSIAGYPLKAVTKVIDGVQQTLIDSYKLMNVTLTGTPVNPNATFIPVMKAALLKSMEANQMAEEEVVATEEVKTEEVVEEVKEEVKTEPVVEEVKEEPKPEVSTDDVLKKLQDEKAALEADNDALKLQLKQAEAPVAEAPEQSQNLESSGPMSQIKALTSDKIRLESENAKLKAELAKPIMKAVMTADKPLLAEQKSGQSPMDSIQ